MRTKLKRIVILAALAVVFAFAGVLVACEKNTNGAHIDVPSDPVEVELGSYSLSEMPDVVDKDGTILTGYEVSVKSVKDESGNDFNYANNMLVVSEPIVLKVTYQASGVDDAVLTLDFADRTAPGLEFKDEGFPIYFFTGQTYSIPSYTLSGGDVDYSKSKITINWLETENAEPVKLFESVLSFKVEKTSGFYQIQMYFEDKSGNGKTYEFVVPVGAPETPVVEEDLYGLAYFEDEFYEVQTTDVRSTMDFKTMTRDELPDEVKAGADESITGATKMWHARKDSLDDGDYLEITLPYITNISEYDYLYFDVYNASDNDRYMALVPQTGNWVMDTRAWVKANSWTRVIFDIAQIDRMNSLALSDFSGTRLYIQPLREGTLNGTDKTKPCVIGEEQTSLYMTNWYVCKGSPAEIGENGAKDPNAADRVFYFDGPGGASYLRYMSSKAEDILSMTVSYDAACKDPDVTDGDGMTEITRASNTADSIGVMRMVGAHITDLSDYAAVAFRVYNPNTYDIGFGYHTGGRVGDHTVKPGWNTLIFSLDHIENHSECGPTYGRTLNSLVVIIRGLQKEGDSIYLGAAYGIKAADLEISTTTVDPVTLFSGEEFPTKGISVRVKDNCEFEWAQGVEVLNDLQYALVSAKPADGEEIAITNGAFIPETSGEYTLTYALRTVAGNAFYDDVTWAGEDVEIKVNITVSDYEEDWIREDKVLYFDTPAGISHIKYVAGQDRFDIEFDTEMKDTAVEGGLGMTKFTNTMNDKVDSLGEYYLQNPYIADISEYSALAIRLYNPNDHAISFGYNCYDGFRRSYTVEPESFGTIVFSVEFMLERAQHVKDGAEGDITNLVLMIYNVPQGDSFYLGAAYAFGDEDLEVKPMDELPDSVATGSTYSVEEGIRPVIVKDTCKYEWARGEQVHGVGYALTSVKKGTDDVEFTLDTKLGIATFDPTETGEYTLGYTAKFWKETESVLDATLDWGSVTASEKVTITLSSFNEDWRQDNKVLYFDTPVGPSHIKYHAGTNRFAVTFDTSVKDAAVSEGLGMTKLTNSVTGNSNGEYIIQAPYITDLSEYAALALRVYNPTKHEINIGYNSSGNQYNYPVAAESYGTIVFSLDHMLNMAQFINNTEKGNINGLVLIIRNVNAGESFYLGAAYAIKSTDLTVAPFSESAKISENADFSAEAALAVTVSDTCAYEWAHGVQVQNIRFIPESVKLEDADVTFTFNKGGSNVLTFAPSASGTYTIGFRAAVIHGITTIEYRTNIPVNWGGKEKMTGTLELELIKFDEAWKQDDKVLYFDTPAGLSNVVWNRNANTNRFTVEFDTSVKDEAVAGGTGMTKFTNLNVASGVDSLGEYYIANPFISDISEYSALAIRVYNPNDHAISFGYNTAGAPRRSYTIEPESFGTIVFSVDYMLTYAEKVKDGADGDITDLVLMIYNVPKGESFYLGAAFALRYEDLEAAPMETSGSVSAGSAYSVDGIRPVVVKESCKYEWARGEQVHGVGYVLTSVKNGSEDVEFTFDQKTGAASFTPAATGNYTLGYTAKLWKEGESVVDAELNWGGAETLTLDVNVTVA